MRKLIPAFAALCLVAFAWAQTTRVGPLPSADSLAINQRVGRTGETITQASGGSNKERVRRGGCYWASDAGAEVTVPTATGTTAICSLYNPQNSGVLVIIKRAVCTYSSGTFGTGQIWHAFNATTTQTAPSGGTLQTNMPALLGSNNASVAQFRTASTVVFNTTSLIPFIATSPILGTTTEPLAPLYDDLDDSIQLLPGTSYQMQSFLSTSTTPKCHPAVFWEEQPLLNGSP